MDVLKEFLVPDLLNKYEQDLFHEFLPFMDKFIVDKECGGFRCNTNRSGQNISSNKRTWFDGRGVWVYSFLYNHIRKDPQYLKVAEKTLTLLFKARNGQRLWPWGYDRQGRDLREHPPDIYGNLFVAEGLIEYSMAAEDCSSLREAKEIIFDCVNLYDESNYVYKFEYQKGIPAIEMPRVLGHWMILLNLCKHILEYHPEDGEIKSLSDRCLTALLDQHLNPEFNLMIEFLEKDMAIPENKLSQFVYIGHAIEALWMMMEEAIRRKDEQLFRKTSGLFKRHVMVAWDDVYGGVFHGLINVNENQWIMEKVLWAQQEVLIGLMIWIEHQDDLWAKEWFVKVYNFVQDKFILRKYGFSYWNIGGDRKMTFVKDCDRIENYHIPRHLMSNLLRLRTLSQKKGKK